MKQCLDCKETKPFSEYNKGTNGALYLPRCKSCHSARQARDYRENWFTYFCRGKKSESKRKGIPFNLTADYLKSIWTPCCPVFGESFVKHDKKHPFCPALDRIDPSKGYVEGNVVWISSRANRIKYDASLEELKTLVKWFEGATTIPQGSTLK